MNGLTKKTGSNASRPKPLLMMPLRRCGSHAIRLRLNFSPQFHSPYPLHIIDFAHLVPLYGDLSDDYNYRQLVIDIIGLLNATMVKWDNYCFDPLDIFESIKDQPRGIHSITWALLFESGRQHKAEVVMDKSLDNVRYGEELLELYEDMLLLNVVRDPRAQINSMNRSIIYHFDSLLNADQWLEAQNLGIKLQQAYPDRVLTIRYEDFILDQKQLLQKICAFIGIEFLDSMLDVSRSDEAAKLSGMSALWQTNTSEPIPGYIDKFRNDLSVEDISIIESMTIDVMKFYGYQPLTNANLPITEDMFTKAQERNKRAKAKAWKDLKASNPVDYQLRRFRIDYIEMIERRLKCEVAPVLTKT